MSTIPCPACSEIIPSELDFCPFCGESTHPVAESLLTDEDRAVADRMAAIAAANTSAPPASSNPDLRLPPHSGEIVCMMCKQSPPVVGDYCQACHDKLELRPEQWDLHKQDQAKNTTLYIVLAVVAVIFLIVVIARTIHHHH